MGLDIDNSSFSFVGRIVVIGRTLFALEKKYLIFFLNLLKQNKNLVLSYRIFVLLFHIKYLI
ncbi:hypothetical protein D3C72_1814640 [compost metagenome]